jgi:hypothetical protein
MRVRLAGAGLPEELCSALDSAGCTFAIDDAELIVAHPTATDGREAEIELKFFLRAWQAKHAADALEVDP